MILKLFYTYLLVRTLSEENVINYAYMTYYKKAKNIFRIRMIVSTRTYFV